MPDISNQKFEHASLEADIERLGKEVSEKKKSPEYEKVPERELIKQTLQPIIKQPPVQQPQQPAAAPDETQILPDYLKDSAPEIKLRVEKLIDSVFHRGIEKTVKEAVKSGPFVLDAFHDALTDKLYDELKKRKLID